MICMTGEPTDLAFLPEIADLGVGIEAGSLGLVVSARGDIGRSAVPCTGAFVSALMDRWRSTVRFSA